MKKLLLTGCSRGIGLAILNKIATAHEPYKIYAVSRQCPEGFSNNPFVHFFSCDLSDVEQTQRVIEAIKLDSEGIDIIINNAGIGKFGEVETLTLHDYTELMNINLTAPFLFISHLLAGMKERNFGRIINITSDADHIGFAEGSLYCASKFGLRGLSDSIRAEVTGLNIAVSTIGPGRVDTYFNRKSPGDRPLSLSDADVANQVMHLLSQSDRCVVERIYLRSGLE